MKNQFSLLVIVLALGIICEAQVCSKVVTNRAGKQIVVGCPAIHIEKGSNCVYVPPIPGAPYPDCCAMKSCPNDSGGSATYIPTKSWYNSEVSGFSSGFVSSPQFLPSLQKALIQEE